MKKEYGYVLKKYREHAKLSIKDVSEILTKQGYRISAATVYNWENNNRQPVLGVVLVLCQLYGISDIVSAFEPDSVKKDLLLKRTNCEEL